jgi:S1-C subfamily serine protease
MNPSKTSNWFGHCASLLAAVACFGLLAFVGESEGLDKKRVKQARAITHGKLKAGKIRPQAPVSPTTTEGMLCEDAGNGARVRAVRQDSPAFNAGLVKGDVIFGVEDQPVQTTADLDNLLGQAMDQGMADVVLSVVDFNTGQSTLVPLTIVPSAPAPNLKKVK